jgi:hypothetical protein
MRCSEPLPQLVTDAIRQVVEAARAEKPPR